MSRDIAQIPEGSHEHICSLAMHNPLIMLAGHKAQYRVDRRGRNTTSVIAQTAEVKH